MGAPATVPRPLSLATLSQPEVWKSLTKGRRRTTKKYAVVNLVMLCVVNSLRHNDLLSQSPCEDILFPGFYRQLSSQRRVHNEANMGDVVKTCEPARPLQRSLGAFGPRNAEKVSPKSLQMVLGTVWEVSRESPESVERVFSDCPRDFLETFRGSRARGPRRHFRDSFGISGPKGPRDLCKGRAGPQEPKKGGF